jgi:hypothetical protein
VSPRRVLILLASALLIIAGAIWLSSQRHLDRAIATGTRLLPELKAALNDVNEIRIAKADGNHATLKKRGAQWIVHERDFAADPAKVRKLLLDLSQLEVVEEKTSNPASYAAINVEDVPPANPDSPSPAKSSAADSVEPLAATRIDVMTPKKTWALIVGKSGGSKNGYARVANAKQSFLVTPLIDAEAAPQRWLEHTIVDIPEARIQSVAVKPANGPAYTVSREKKEQENFTVANIPAKRKLSDESAGNVLARGLEGVSLDDVQKKPDVPTALPTNTTVERSQATYKTFDGVTVTVSGRKESTPGLKKDDPKVEKFFITLTAASSQKATEAEAGKLNARVAGKEFEISSYKYEGMFKPLQDLLEKK